MNLILACHKCRVYVELPECSYTDAMNYRSSWCNNLHHGHITQLGTNESKFFMSKLAGNRYALNEDWSGLITVSGGKPYTCIPFDPADFSTSFPASKKISDLIKKVNNDIQELQRKMSGPDGVSDYTEGLIDGMNRVLRELEKIE